MKIHVMVIPSPAELVIWYMLLHQQWVIDRLRKLDDYETSTSRSAAKWLVIFDKGMR